MKRSWSNYEWAKWIPDEVRTQIEGFWLDSWNRGPDAWLEDMNDQDAPKLGLSCSLPKLGGNEWVNGRFVHAWNNIGRMVHDDGTFSYVYFTYGGLLDSKHYIEPTEPTQAEGGSLSCLDG